MKPDIETAQTPFELDTLLILVEAHKPQRILEIGTWYGGTLWHWLQISPYVVSVDANEDQTYRPQQWGEWAEEAGAELHLIQGFSYQPQVFDQVQKLGPFDLLFIDAEHTYEAVKTDWELYRPMVSEGGMVVFHDFQPRPGPYGVDILWRDIKAQPGTRTVEIVETSNPPGFQGISAVWV